MNLIKKNKYKKLIVLSVFLLIFFIGNYNYKDFGVSWDEEGKRKIGYVNLSYVAKKILPENIYTKLYQYSVKSNFTDEDQAKIDSKKNNELELPNYTDRSFGPGYEVLPIIGEYIFKFNTEKEIYEFKHLLNFNFFFISLLFFYKFLCLKFKNYFLNLLAVLILFLTPRIFVDSFVNPLDLPFLGYFIIANYFGYKFYKKNKFKNLNLFSIFCALSSSARVIGLINIATYSCLIFFNNQNNDFRIKIKNILLLIFITIIFYVFFTPLLWENTFDNFLYIFNSAKNVSNIGEVFYLSNFFKTNELPWHYLPIWILSTIPELIVVLFLISSLFIIFNFVKKKDINENVIILSFQIIIPVGLQIYFKSPVFDGWRHFYFIYPAIIVISLTLIDHFFEYKIKYYNFILIVFIIQIGYLSKWMIKNHPFQNLYFNQFVEKGLEKFEKDYHGLSNKQLLEFLLKYEKGKIYYSYYGSNLDLSIKTLAPEDREKFVKIDLNDNKENYYFFLNNRSRVDQQYMNSDKYIFLKKIEIDNTFVNGILSKKKN
jgi:hypothetical protein